VRTTSSLPSVEQSCYWLARRSPRPVTPLTGRVDTDVAIVGAGLTGLWTALCLKQLDASREVLVVEQAVAAYGASGRNAGMLSETVEHGHGLAIEHFGEAEARRLAALGERNVTEMVAELERWRIDCGFEPTGRLMVALTAAHLEEARRTVTTAERLGLASFRLLGRDEVVEALYSPLYLGGVEVRGGGILDPVRLVDGLQRVAEELGVRVYERTPVRALESAGKQDAATDPRR
jgi:glycine/D-amino acid oxidase-like deaminating enzyme